MQKYSVMKTLFKFLGILLTSLLVWMIVFSLTGIVDEEGSPLELFPGMLFCLSLLSSGLIYLGLQYNQIRRLEQRIDSSQSNIRIIEERNQQLLSKANRLVEKHQQTEKETVVEVVKSRPGSLRGRTSYIGNAREFDYYLNEMPDLVVNQNVEKLLEAIFETENELTNRRLIYNQEVELFNAEIQQFPVNLLAKGLKIQKKDYYLTVNSATDITDEMLGL